MSTALLAGNEDAIRRLASGRYAILNANRSVSRIVTEAEAAEYLDQLSDYENRGCECEVDWTCGRCREAGRYGGYTWIETRYDGLDTDEEGREAF